MNVTSLQLAPRGPEFRETAKEEFRNRVVPAYPAYLCCKNGPLRYAKALNDWADLVEQKFQENPAMAGQFRLPLNSPLGMELIRLVFPRFGESSRILVYSGVGQMLGQVDLPVNGRELDLMTAPLRALGRDHDPGARSCRTCIRKHLLGQHKPRKRGLWTAGADGETNKLRIRVPHR